MKIETTFLRSRVARRIFSLFVFCALLPICVLAVVTFYQVSGELRSNSDLELQRASKAKGMAVLERLDTLDTELQTARVDEGQKAQAASPRLQAHFRSVQTVNEKRDVSAWFGPPLPTPPLAPDDLRYLGSGGTLLITTPGDAADEVRLRLVRLRDAARPDAGIIVGEIDGSYLWDRETLPAPLQLTVFDSNSMPLYGTAASVPPRRDGLAQGNRPGRSFEWALQGDRYDAAYWDLFLAQKFHAKTWTIVLSHKQEDATAVLRRFRSTFPLVALLAFWVVTLLSSIQIRRTLVPLEKLQEGTRLIGAQHFESRVEVQSQDEFGDLAASFNAMAGQLGKQFEALKTIHGIDQAILASLHRDGIVDAVLDRLPSLLASECCAIAMTKDDRFSSGASITVISTEAGTQKRVEGTQFSAADLQLVKENPSVLQLSPSDELPQFLQPLRRRGGISLTIFPVSGEKQLTAVVICVQPGAAPMSDVDQQHARQIADQLAIAFGNVELMEAMECLHWGTLTALARAIDAKSGWTGGHSERVTRMALKIGRAMGFSAEELKIMHRGGLLHDIGKIGIPQNILDKQERLEPEEMNIMRGHVKIGVRILEPIAGFSDALPIVAQHHEWFNGAGYPEGLAGEQISLHARIFAVADVYDAVTSERPYRKGQPPKKALEVVQSGSGTQFDPRVVEVFGRVWKEEEQSDSKRPENESRAQPA